MYRRTSCGEHTRHHPGCRGCRRYAREYRAMREEAIRNGTWDRSNISGDEMEMVRQHVQSLLDLLGIGSRWVALAAGVSTNSVALLLAGQSAHIYPATAESLLGVTAQACLRRIKPSTLVDGTGTSRRLRSMAVDGWSAHRIAGSVHLAVSVVRRHRAGRGGIRWDYREAYRELYEKVYSLPDPWGGSVRARDEAIRHGYLGSEQWADEDIDDPRAEPLPLLPDTEDHVAVSLQIRDALESPAPGKAAGYPRAVMREIAKRARHDDWPWEQIAELLGFKSAATAEYLVRGRPDRKPVKRERAK